MIATSARAAETSLGAYFGSGQGVNAYGIEGAIAPSCDCANPNERLFEPRFLAHVALWEAHSHSAQNASLVDFAGYGALAWRGPAQDTWRPMIEAALGIHLITHTQINSQIMSTAFQFGERLTAGFEFNQGMRWAFGGFIEHVSNARIKEPNNGLTYGGVDFRIWFP